MNVKEEMVSFFMDGVKFSLRDRKRLKVFLGKLFKQEGAGLASLRYVFCSDRAVLKINREFLSHEDFTDIITFNFAGAGEPVEGEVYISIDRVRENARIFRTGFGKELHRVIFHGALHLCGYRDKKASEKVVMRAREDYWLKKYFGK